MTIVINLMWLAAALGAAFVGILAIVGIVVAFQSTDPKDKFVGVLMVGIAAILAFLMIITVVAISLLIINQDPTLVETGKGFGIAVMKALIELLKLPLGS